MNQVKYLIIAATISLTTLICLIAFNAIGANSAPVVSNVKAQQRPGTKIVDITYDVDDPDGDTLTVTVEISDDGGNSFKVPAKTFSGDVGSGIKLGKGKKITWDAGKDAPNVFGANYRAKVTASDGVIVISTKTIIGKDGSEMILIPAGEFLMGSPPEEGNSDEHPQHTVYLDAFYIDKYEVTNAQYKKFMDATGHAAPSWWNDNNFNKPEQPVVGVTWFDAEAYCKWANKRLPTEAEWEKAARGTVGRRYPWGNEVPNAGGIWRANYYIGENGVDDGFQYAAPVGSFPAGVSPYGIHDMAGNVLEWVADWYDGGYYSVSPKNNPKGPNSGSVRVLRGGAWLGSVNLLRAASRIWDFPVFGNFNVGLRGAQDIP
jgi:formylglycine-generating enzyme required for sulfatase activity